MSYDTNRTYAFIQSGRKLRLYKIVRSAGRIIDNQGRVKGGSLDDIIYPDENITNGLRIEYTKLEKIFVENSCEVLDRFGTGCVYFYPSYIPRYIYEKMNNEKKNSLKDGNSSCDLKEKKSVDEKKEKSIYSNKERTMYRSGFMYLDKAWDPIQKRINRLISTKSLMPASWYITFGLVVQKKK